MNSEFTISVHALVYLEHKGCSVSSEELAENICTNPARIRKVVGKLRKAGLVSTKEGLGGGYQIARAGSEITLARICGILEAVPVKAQWKSGSMDMDCLVASGMSGIMDDIYGEMNERCRAYLETITIEDISENIFGKMQGDA